MTQEYRVLARKYRPQTFDDLVGQEVLVRTLSNAIKSGRLAHAYLLTGIRGIGKTTTARIIAKALNCIGEDGKGEATTSPCGVCPNCLQISEDRHPDVMEMDAASRTGVGDIRDLIETVHYAPTQARYKIYIIDEVHMLSTSAFNALLKTLEEPPPHVKFVFATTETRKIPVTILSRCQRFDLKRLDVDMLAEHLNNVCKKEDVSAEEEGLRLIAMSAEGSVRDGLSLIDRAISHSYDEGGKAIPVTTDAIRGMLGLADKTKVFEMMEAMFEGKVPEALEALAYQYNNGSDVILLLQDMMAITHLITRLKLDPKDDLGPSYSQTEREYAKTLSEKLSVPNLTRAWQMLLKGLDEAKRAPDPLMAAEMVMIRLCHASDLPSPEHLIKQIKEQGVEPSAPTPPNGGGGGTRASAPATASAAVASQPVQQAVSQPQPEPVAQASHLTLAANNPAIELNSYLEVVQYFAEQKEMRMKHALEVNLAPVAFEQGTITVKKVNDFSQDILRDITTKLRNATDKPWAFEFAEADNVTTLAQDRKAAKEAAIEKVKQSPEVAPILHAFEGAVITNIREEESE